MFHCPQCQGITFLRAMRIVVFVPTWLGPRERLKGYLARCEECHLDVRIEGNTVKRLRPVQTVQQQAAPPAEKENKPGIEPHRTPGLAWDRGTR